MAIKFRDKEPEFIGAVLKTEEHYWMDGMLEVTAVVWDSSNQRIDRVQVGYYGIDNCNLQGCSYEVDATPETWREVLRSIRPAACRAFAKSVTEYKNAIQKGTHAVVVRGKKVPKGTKVEVFWIGEKPTYQSRMHDWMRETETVAGCYDESGNKIWIKAEYLKNVDQIKSPNAKERRKFIKAYMQEQAHRLGAPWKLKEAVV